MTITKQLRIPPLVFLSACLIAASVLAVGVHTQDAPAAEPPAFEAAPSADASADETSNLWFVELEGAPAAEGGDVRVLRSEKAAFRSAARAAGLKYSERYAFDNLWNGLSVEVNPSELSTLSRVKGVKGLHRVGRHSAAPFGEFVEPALATALAQTGADVVQSELGFTGAGVRVGVIDSGIDYHHPDLGGGTFPNGRVVAGYDFVGEAFTGLNTPAPDGDPDDCRNPTPSPFQQVSGHGTFVAGIIGADGHSRGVAPDVKFGAYRIWGCNGTSTSDIIIAAMERALEDRMDVVNLSLGDANEWPQSPLAVAADRLVRKGVVVVAALGNDGATGAFSARAPAVGGKVIAVASFTNTHINTPSFNISNDGLAVAYTRGTGPQQPSVNFSGSYPMARTATPASLNDACNAAPPVGDLTGKVALIRRGTCNLYEKARNAQNAGAAGVVIYNNAPGIIGPNVTPPTPADPPVTIPVVGISAADGVTINNRLAAGPVTLTWSNQWISSPPLANGGLIAASSSYGMSPDLTLKPDIGAPGGLIRSTFPLERGATFNGTGTSFATAHVSGAVALLLEARPNTPAAAVNAILQNSADPRLWGENPSLGLLDNVHRQGAGMLQIDKAILSTTRIEPGKLSLGESEAGPASRSLTIENAGPAAVTYQLSHAPALASGGSTFVPAFFNASASVAFTSEGVPVTALTVPPGGAATLDVTITASALLADRSQYGGYLVFTPDGGGPEYSVPYAGFKGDYQSIQALAPTASGYPWLAKFNGTSYSNQPAGAAYTMQGGDVPYFLVHLDHHARQLKFEVFDAHTGRAWHTAFQQEYVPRGAASTSFSAYSWDGRTTHGGKVLTVPDGQYVLRLTVRKALGDDDDPAHTEVWTSPVVNIARP